MEKEIEKMQARCLEIKHEMQKINDVLVAEQRSTFTAEEDKRYSELADEAKTLKKQLDGAAIFGDSETREEAMRAAQAAAQNLRFSTARQRAGAAFRLAFSGRSKTNATVELRDAYVTLAQDVAGTIGITVGDMIQPLEKGLILGKLGIPLKTGLSGDYRYPLMPYLEARIEEEDVAMTPSEYKVDAVVPHPKRTCIAVTVGNWALEQSDITLYNEVVDSMRRGIERTLNHWMFQPSAFVSNVFGPLAYDAASNAINVKALKSATLYKDILSLVGDVEGSGAYNDGTCAFVMSAKMAAVLRATPVGNGDRMILAPDNTIAGFPVYFSEYIESDGAGNFNATAKNIGFGRWSDVQVAQFGNLRLVIDTVSLAKRDLIEISINSNFAVDVLRPKSFAIGTLAD